MHDHSGPAHQLAAACRPPRTTLESCRGSRQPQARITGSIQGGWIQALNDDTWLVVARLPILPENIFSFRFQRGGGVRCVFGRWGAAGDGRVMGELLPFARRKRVPSVPCTCGIREQNSGERSVMGGVYRRAPSLYSLQKVSSAQGMCGILERNAGVGSA